MADDPIREKWSSRAAFIVAAIGSAIGFGNVWRFPNLAFKHGGGAFFIPYFLALFIIGIPILILEVAIGQYYQTGDAGAFGRVNKRFRGLGLASVFCGFILNTYYCVLLAWVCRMFIFSCRGSDGRWANVTGQEAYDWFLDHVTGAASADASRVPSRLVWENVGCLAFVWLFIFVSLAFGVKWTGRISYFTVGLPIVILFVLLGLGASLDGAGEGVREYIGRWDMSVLKDNGEVWSEAVGQIFFSLGVTLGILTAYSSYNSRGAPVFSNSIIIALSNSFFSFIAGFAVFCIIGYIAQKDDVPIADLQAISGPGLMYGTFPVALSSLRGGGHWERLFFISLFLLGIDSAFALAEAVITVFNDTIIFYGMSRRLVTFIVCLLGFVSGLLYCTDTGFDFLDVTDFYVNFMMLLVGFFECLAVGWIFAIRQQAEKVGAAPVVSLLLTAFLPVVLASSLWFGLGDVGGPGVIGAGFIGLGLGLLAGFAMTYVLVMRERARNEDAGNMPMREYIYELFMGNVMYFRNELRSEIRYIPYAWFVLIKYFIPQVLFILFVNLANSKTESGKSKFGHYMGLPRGYQALGIFVFGGSASIIALGILFPRAYACFSVTTIKEDQEKEAALELAHMEEEDMSSKDAGSSLQKASHPDGQASNLQASE